MTHRADVADVKITMSDVKVRIGYAGLDALVTAIELEAVYRTRYAPHGATRRDLHDDLAIEAMFPDRVEA